MPPVTTEPAVHESPLRYDGADLPVVASRCRLTEDEVVQLHQGTTFTGTASLLAIALWVAGPPLVSWIVWAVLRRKDAPVAERV